MNRTVRDSIVLLTLLILCLSCGKKGEVLQRFSFVAEGDQSVFVQTKERFALDYDSTASGVFVQSINGTANTRTAYWLYFINSKPIPKASDAFVPAAGDTIEWRLVSGY